MRLTAILYINLKNNVYPSLMSFKITQQLIKQYFKKYLKQTIIIYIIEKNITKTVHLDA
jgi:hypothetical protein